MTSVKDDKSDIVITGGQVTDPETGLDELYNVGMKGDIQGKETIDSTGHVVCPCFINMHIHNCNGLLRSEIVLIRDRDDVTMRRCNGPSMTVWEPATTHNHQFSDWYASSIRNC